MKIKSKTGLRVFSYADIKSWKPCYDPVKFIPSNWRGTAIDILNLDKVPVADRLWVVLRTEITSERVMRLFAVWCARQVQHLMKDPRSIAAIDVAERFAYGLATKEELDAAGAARGAARGAAWGAAGAAGAAGDAAWAAAGAARGAAWGAAWGAAGAAWAARDAAGAAATDAQLGKLKEMLLAEGLERLEAKRSKKGKGV